MFIVTGKSGVGKTTILKASKLKNIFYADDFVKNNLYKNNHDVAKQIYKLWPEVKGEKFVDTKKLGKILFKNQHLLDKVHSLISSYVIEKITSLPKNSIIEMSAYINYEKIYKDLFQTVILIERDFEDLQKFNHIPNMHQPIKDNLIKYNFKINNNTNIKNAANKLKEIVLAGI